MCIVHERLSGPWEDHAVGQNDTGDLTILTLSTNVVWPAVGWIDSMERNGGGRGRYGCLSEDQDGSSQRVGREHGVDFTSCLRVAKQRTWVDEA